MLSKNKKTRRGGGAGSGLRALMPRQVCPIPADCFCLTITCTAELHLNSACKHCKAALSPPPVIRRFHFFAAISLCAVWWPIERYVPPLQCIGRNNDARIEPSYFIRQDALESGLGILVRERGGGRRGVPSCSRCLCLGSDIIGSIALFDQTIIARTSGVVILLRLLLLLRPVIMLPKHIFHILQLLLHPFSLAAAHQRLRHRHVPCRRTKSSESWCSWRQDSTECEGRSR